MTARTTNDGSQLPARFEDLVARFAPKAITNQRDLDATVEMIDALMANGKLTAGQMSYMATLVLLVETYEASHHAIDTDDITGLDSLRHLLAANDMDAADLARLLDVPESAGPQILSGERELTAEDLEKLAGRFKVSPRLFGD